MPIVSQPLAWQGAFLLILGALFRALYVISTKRALGRLSPRFVVVVNMLGAGTILTVVMLAFFPPRIADWSSWPHGILWPLLATAVLNIAVQYGEIRSLSLADASLVAPMHATAPALTLLTGFLILREVPTAWGWIGVLFLSAGSYILSRSGRSDVIAEDGTGRRHLHTLRDLILPWTTLAKNRGVRLAFYSSVVASVSIIFDKVVVLASNAFFNPAIVLLIVGLVFLMMLRREHIPSRLTPREVAGLLVAPLLFAAVLVLFNAAFYYGLASHVSAFRRMSILFVVLLAAPLLKERGHPERVWGGVLMAIGAILCAF